MLRARIETVVRAVLPAQISRRLQQLYRRARRWPPVGWVRFGSFRRLTPVSREWGSDRGLPLDRYYIEAFLGRHAQDIQGHVLEIKDDTYTRRFGGDRVTQSDVLHAAEGNPKATIVADLTSARHIPSDTFHCVILTQTLQYIYESRAALQTVYRILKPGGVLLATLPGISQRNRALERWDDYWRFTTVSSRKLLAESFPSNQVIIDGYGNVLVATAFLHGLATEELRPDELDQHDPDYEVLIAVRAVKPETVA